MSENSQETSGPLYDILFLVCSFKVDALFSRAHAGDVAVNHKRNVGHSTLLRSMLVQTAQHMWRASLLLFHGMQYVLCCQKRHNVRPVADCQLALRVLWDTDLLALVLAVAKLMTEPSSLGRRSPATLLPF